MLSELLRVEVRQPDRSGAESPAAEEEGAAADEEQKEEENSGQGIFNMEWGGEDPVRAAVHTAAGAAAFLAMTFLSLCIRRKRRRKRLKKMKCAGIFIRFLDMLHFAGYMEGYEGTEKTFKEELIRTAWWLNREEVERLVETVSRSAYGREEPSAKEKECLLSLYGKTVQALKQNMRGMKKWIFRYISAFD